LEAIVSELERFIDEVHSEPYNLFNNNCIHKHARIVRKARELGHNASLIACISVRTVKPMPGVPLIGPHFYAEVEDKLVDVAMEPELERILHRNEDRARLLPINISKLRRMFFEEGPLPRSWGIRWPWRKR